MPLYYEEPQSNQRIFIVNQPKHYGFFKFLFDATLTVLTGGLWLIWIFVREMRKSR